MRSTYANRGKPLETFIEFANERYRFYQVAFIEKQNTAFIPIRDRRGRIIDVKVDHKATFDFMGRYKQYPIAIEAKETKQDTIRWDAVQPNQAKDLDFFCNQPGTIGLILVNFYPDTFYAVPWAFWKEAYDLRVRKRDKSTSKRVFAFNEEWAIPKKFSAREEDFLPSWLISTKDSSYGLNYLQNAEKYIAK